MKPPDVTLYDSTKRALLAGSCTAQQDKMNHYTILSLPFPTGKQSEPFKLSTAEEIKQAYRLALLTHHPDKNTVSSTTKSTADKPSIDAIKLAYTILSDPKSRVEYDRDLILQSQKADTIDNTQLTDTRRSFRTGEELIDLDDMAYDEAPGIWYRACRCGEQRGYTVTETQLEEEERKGGREVVVGCIGCSLWLRVGFSVAEEGDDAG
jgi:diphthamide biosynthesis protein 4